jgi:hypothetical protein
MFHVRNPIQYNVNNDNCYPWQTLDSHSFAFRSSNSKILPSEEYEIQPTLLKYHNNNNNNKLKLLFIEKKKTSNNNIDKL